MPVSSPDKSEELTMTDAASLAGVSVETLRKVVKRGEIAIARKVGNAYLLDRAAVEAWARRREEEQKR